MICFLRASTIQYDVRLQKYIQACSQTQTPYIAVTWDRVLNCNHVYENEFQYKRFSPYGRKWKNALNLVLWQFHLLHQLFKFRSKYKVIHACNIETLLPALFMKLWGKKVVFDIYDSVFIPAERFLSKHFVDTLILPNIRRLAQVGIQLSEVKNFLEVENVPFFSKNITIPVNHNLQEKIKLSYVGVFERNIRGLENLVEEVVENESLVLDIAGIGSGFEDVVKKTAEKTSRITYHGSVNYQKALEIMGGSDFIVAMYYNLNPLHKYASPNKYYESLYLGIPMITTEKTLVGDMAEENKTGYAIGESKSEFHHFLQNSQTPEFEKSYVSRTENAHNQWQQKFSNYGEQKLCREYVDLLKSL